MNVDNEANKFSKDDEIYFKYIDELEEMNPSIKDIIYNFPVFVGNVNLARSLFFYELYKKVLNLSGNIAEVGTYKGASFMLWAKLIKTFERNNVTRVYGFDWFQGLKPGENDSKENEGLYTADYETLNRLITIQDLDGVAVLNKLDATKELIPYIDERPWLRFKIVFIDCAIQDVIEASLKALWPRLVNGGILILDHYGLSCSPTESSLVEQYTGKREILQMPFNRHSSGYVVK
jgi:predicted O-methyltransferase YrrM